ncbi:UvrB/UvrC motif-containing protein [Stieleria sp. JC731]|uniref:UvrB/UvrC motif-containing protein n=1 Tax=Stieleria sp. JC731 TaxID=2894195 RepID=UPI001E5FCED8|nr:UvrB/UvrC motif-containing protein [Stieleria sp. JC731]MCC9603369.1 UvrB/UvrC motif-containing protein [Stieleria sp. JC731]
MSSYFHLPLHIDWNVEFVLGELTRRQIDAALAGSEIHITLSSERCQAWREKHQSKLDRRIAKGLPRRPQLAIRHFPNRFLRNIELDRDVFGAPWSEEHVILTQASILDLGATLLDSLDTELDIALSHSKRPAEISEFRKRIESLIAEKEQHIEALDFEPAAAARDREMEVRDELETFLLHGAE